jgi:hypothetical protein
MLSNTAMWKHRSWDLHTDVGLYSTFRFQVTVLISMAPSTILSESTLLANRKLSDKMIFRCICTEHAT